MAESRYEGLPPRQRTGGRRAPLELAPAIRPEAPDEPHARTMLAIGAATLDRWKDEATRRSVSVEEMTREAVEAWLSLNHAPLDRPWQPGSPDRRRNNRSLLDATGTKAAEHVPAAREPRRPV